MGNRSSSSAAPDESQKGGGSGMYLAPEVQAKINQDFESHIIQTEWNTYRKLFLQRHTQREATSQIHREEIQQKMNALQSQAKQVHDRLDQMVDAAKSQLVDLEVEVGHDVDRLGKRFEGGLSSSSSKREGSCLDVRVELSHCYKSLKDSGECQIFAQKLEKCVTEALASS